MKPARLFWPTVILTVICISSFVAYRLEKSNSNGDVEMQTTEVSKRSTKHKEKKLSDDEYRQLMLEKDTAIRQNRRSELEDSFSEYRRSEQRRELEERIDAIQANMAAHAKGKGDPRSIYSHMEKELRYLLNNEQGNSGLFE